MNTVENYERMVRCELAVCASGSVVNLKVGTQTSRTYCWVCQSRFRVRARRRRPRTLQKSSQKAVRVVQACVRACEGCWKVGRQDRDVYLNARNNQ